MEFVGNFRVERECSFGETEYLFGCNAEWLRSEDVLLYDVMFGIGRMDDLDGICLLHSLILLPIINSLCVKRNLFLKWGICYQFPMM